MGVATQLANQLEDFATRNPNEMALAELVQGFILMASAAGIIRLQEEWITELLNKVPSCSPLASIPASPAV